MVSEELLHRQAVRQHAAEAILARLGLMERWAEVGVPKLVGAVAYGLVVAPDIDIEIYCDVPTVDPGFAIVSELAQQRAIWKVRFSNELDRADKGLYWQLRYRAADAEVWKLDMWLLGHDHPGPRSVDLVEPMKRALTDETRAAILGIKEALLGQPHVHSMEIYEAVLDDGVRSATEFGVWRSSQRKPGCLTFWQPSLPG
jgi:hypothetical protein